MAHWTLEEDEKLKALHAEGLSCALIGMRMNKSRNAVIGRISRLGMAGRRTVVRAKNQPSRVQVIHTQKDNARKASKAAGHSWFAGATRPRPTFPVADNDPAEPDTVGLRKALVDLENNECRFPMGDPLRPGFGFCGLEKVEGISYCEHHAKRCLVPVPVRTGRPFKVGPSPEHLKAQAASKDELEGVE